MWGQSLRRVLLGCLIPCSILPFVFLHENKWNSAVICRGKQSPLDWGGLQASSGFSSTLSWQFRESEGEHCSPALPWNDNWKEPGRGLQMQNANHMQCCSNALHEGQIIEAKGTWFYRRTKELCGRKTWQTGGFVAPKIWKDMKQFPQQDVENRRTIYFFSAGRPCLYLTTLPVLFTLFDCSSPLLTGWGVTLLIGEQNSERNDA